MRVTWESEDVRCGRIFGAHGVKERGIIGYDPREQDSQSKYMLVSLADGMVICTPTTKFLIAKHLNDGDYVPSELLEV